MSNIISSPSATEQAKLIAQAFDNNINFDLEKVIEVVTEHIQNNPLTKTQITLLNKFENSEITGKELQKQLATIDSLFQNISDDTEEPDSVDEQSSVSEENSSDMTNIFTTDRGYHAHKALKKYPVIRPDAHSALADDIKKAGEIHKPIILYKNEIVDGRARYEICKRLKIQPKYMEWKGSDEELHEYLDSVHIHKKEVGQSQRAILALENLDRFEKKSDAIQEQKDKAKGKKTETTHDSRDLASKYYFVSTGLISKASFLSKKTSKGKLYQMVRKGQLTLDFALSIFKMKLEDSQILDFIAGNNLDVNQARLLVKIMKDDPEFYQMILSAPDKLIENFSIFNYKKDYSNLYNQLKEGTLTLEEARKIKKDTQPDTKSINQDDDNSKEAEKSPDLDQSSIPFDINNALKSKIHKLAQKNKITVDQFLTQLLDRYYSESEEVANG